MQPGAENKKKYLDGLELMRRPVLPLVRLFFLLYLTGPFQTAAELIDELNEELETGGVTYPDPKTALAPYLDELAGLEILKKGGRPDPVFSEQDEPLDPMEALETLVCHRVLVRELETVNSLLCHPCGCSLCCTGPDAGMEQEFFGIPLAEEETELFGLEVEDTPESRATDPYSGDEYAPGGVPFYRQGAGIHRFRTGFSLILPKGERCPNLDSGGGCAIYPDRPEVCRRPQIFSYLIEESGEKKTARGKLLAVTDCPYVRDLEEEIAAYAASCGLELVLRQNKG